MKENRRVFISDQVPPPIGPYSQAIGARGFLFCSGQIAPQARPSPQALNLSPPSLGLNLPLDSGSNLPSRDELVKAQTRAVMENLRSVLAAAQVGFGDVVKTTVYLVNMMDFEAMNEVYSHYFEGTSPPARSTVAVQELPRQALVEIEIMASLREEEK